MTVYFFFWQPDLKVKSMLYLFTWQKCNRKFYRIHNNSKLSGTRSNSADETAIILFPLIYCVTKEMRYGARCLYTCLLYFSSIAKKYMIDVSKEKHLEVMRQFPTLFWTSTHMSKRLTPRLYMTYPIDRLITWLI